MRHTLHRLAAVSLTALAALSPLAAQAAGTVQQVDITCSGKLTTSDASGFSLQCDGNLGLNGQDDTARLWSDGEITLSATGDLILNHLLLDAPSYTFNAGNSLLLASDVKLPTPYPVTSGVIVRTVDLDSTRAILATAVPGTGGSVHLQAGGDVSLSAGPVPEPSAMLLGAFGLAAIFVARQRRTV